MGNVFAGRRGAGRLGLAAVGSLLSTSLVFGQVADVKVQADPSVTTVAPLSVQGLAPIPDVGAGATYFTPDDLQKAAHDERENWLEARSDAATCGGATEGDSSEDLGAFNLGALFSSERVTEKNLSDAAAAAATATQAAIDARLAAAKGTDNAGDVEVTELARQDAVKAYQAAQAANTEAHARVADWEDEKETNTSLNNAAIRAIVNDRSIERSNNMGYSGIYVPAIYKQLRLTNVVAHVGLDNGSTVMRVTGLIVNPRKRPTAVPPIWVNAVDRFGTTLKAQQAEAKRGGSIPAGGSVPFNFVLKGAPPGTARAVVTFAPYHQAPLEKSASFFCRGG